MFRDLSNVPLYGKGILQLSTSRLTEELQCTKVRTNCCSKNKGAIARQVAPNPNKGRKWNLKVSVQEVEAALRHAVVVGKFQFGRGGLAWLRQTDVEQNRSQREEKTCCGADMETGGDDKGCKGSGSGEAGTVVKL